MKNSKKIKTKDKKSSKSSNEKRWASMAAFYESDESLETLSQSTHLSSAELRAISKKAKTKPISIRIPEIDIIALKRISKKINEGKYQKLIIQAIERFIDEEEGNEASA